MQSKPLFSSNTSSPHKSLVQVNSNNVKLKSRLKDRRKSSTKSRGRSQEKKYQDFG